MICIVLNENDKELLISSALEWGKSNVEKGEVFTRSSIVQFMLKSSKISDDLLNPNTKILEPSCGQGEFVIAIAEILCNQIREQNLFDENSAVENFSKLITAFEISDENIKCAKLRTINILKSIFTHDNATKIVNEWYVHSDFLLYPHKTLYTHIVGNPPYIRIENIPLNLLNAYRKLYFTMKDRADLYIAFYEKSLSLLEPNGILSFICTDRWTKNKYGSSLRELIFNSYQLDLYVDLYGVNAFQTNVLTYPAITQISKKKNKSTIIINGALNNYFSEIAPDILNNSESLKGKLIRSDIMDGKKPWIFSSLENLNLISRLERDFSTLSDSLCQVYIGAATGNNKVYLIDNELDIEPCRKVPVVKAADLKNGNHKVANKSIINTYDENGVIDLYDYPKLRAYLMLHEKELRNRHIAKINPKSWFKTIDRVYPERAKEKKLLIPDISSKLTVIYDGDGYHPNNSIYYICSTEWNLRALQAILMSGLGQFFMEMYSTKISGGHLRFQSQHLRKIRVPSWQNIPEEIKLGLEQSAIDCDILKARELVSIIYKLTPSEKEILGF